MKIQNKSSVLRRTAVFYAIALIIMHILFSTLSVIATYVDGDIAQQGMQKVIEIISIIFSAMIDIFVLVYCLAFIILPTQIRRFHFRLSQYFHFWYHMYLRSLSMPALMQVIGKI